MKYLAIAAAASFALAGTVHAQDGLSPERQQTIQTLLGALQACDEADGEQKLAVCELSMASVSALQPTIEFEHELMLSFLAEVSIRSSLSDAYFAQQNLNKHCENVEKIWATRSFASGASSHPAYAEIDRRAQIKKVDVQACREIGGTPEWGAPL